MTKHPQIALLAVAAALSLSACSSEPEATAPDAPVPSEASEVAATAGTGQAPEGTDSEGIPAAMLGVWDYVEGTCDPASDLRLEIAPDHLTFYESYGTVQSVTRDGDDVTFALAMEGEGETWQESLTYRLVEGGTILESDMPAPVGEGQLRRKRCEG
ncbi:hypothetical protein [Aurantiacibacter gilvus]|uniref:Lipoprotein n=1 Tax=Aurantiacibacter gilvus TaxID=3139141 RepID=A0ABU9IFX9_9SPHN